MAHAWLALQAAGIVAVVAGVLLLAGVAWALIVAGVVVAGVAEVKS